ncbi:MAG: hypothetical protein KDE68_09410 [Rhodocyclaceae bacterium]|nr:hypothetical protein [Rhodocyclaceae bacterium]
MLLSTSDPAAAAAGLLQEVRGRLQAVSSHEPDAALDEVIAGFGAMLESGDWPLLDLVAGLGQLDESAQPHVRQALKGFLQASALKTGRGDLLYAASARFFGAMAQACAEVLQRDRSAGAPQGDLMAEVATRLIRASAGRLKWDHLAYGPYDSEVWTRLGATFVEAAESGRLTTLVRLRAGRETETSTYREYVRAVALQCSGLDQLPVELIDVADRLIHYLLPAMHLSASPVEGARFYVSPANGGQPRRIVRALGADEAAWYFSPLMAERVMSELEAMLRKGVVPGALEGGPGTKERILACIRHFRRAWYDIPVSRRHRRHPMDGQIAAVRGFVSLRQMLCGAGAQTLDWALRDASVSGLGMVAPLVNSSLPRIGELVGLKTDENAGWRLGMVRRIQRDDVSQAFVGVETFASSPKMVRADDGRAPIDVLLCDPLHRGGVLRVVAPFHALRSGTALFVAEQGAVQKLKPLGSVWRGSEFEVRTYLVL